MVQNYVWRLRKALAADGGAEIVTRGRAYELLIDRELIDALRFERLVGEATRGAPGDAARQALALFHGDPLADISDEPFAGAEIRRLEALRLTAAELAIDADLAEGRHQEVVGEIDALLAENPLRERLHAQRLLALYRCGRQADALAAYRDARRALVEDVGIEPGPELQRLHAAILRQDPSLAVPQAVSELPPELDATASPPLIGRDERAARALAALAADGRGRRRAGRDRRRLRHRQDATGGRARAGLAQRASGTVLYASGVDRSEVALAAIARACAAHAPTLLVLDDADRAPAEVRHALQASPPARALVLATGQEAAVLGRLAPDTSLVLEPLDGRGVEAIAPCPTATDPGSLPRAAGRERQASPGACTR